MPRRRVLLPDPDGPMMLTTFDAAERRRRYDVDRGDRDRHPAAAPEELGVLGSDVGAKPSEPERRRRFHEGAVTR